MLDAKLGSIIKEKLGINCLYSAGEPQGAATKACARGRCCRDTLLRANGGVPALQRLCRGRAASTSTSPHPLHPPCPILPAGVMELTRGIRNQLTSLVAGLSQQDLRPMSLGLSHSLSRYKLKFSPDKVDTMIVQVRRPWWAGGRRGCAGRGGGWRAVGGACWGSIAAAWAGQQCTA